MALSPGETLGGYRLEGLLGRGGAAEVYRAYQPALERYVALKVLPEEAARQPQFKARFRTEARTVAALRHPHILVVYDWGEEHGVAFLACELVEGGSLAERVGDPLSPAECLGLLRPLASALDYAHAQGLVHRDVKPANILLRSDGTPVLSDFGLAGMLGRAPKGVPLWGTPAYLAPECWEEVPVSPAADVYSLAVVAFELLTGTLPFTGATPEAVLAAQRRSRVPSLRQRNPALPAAVQAVMDRGLSPDPARRPAAAGTFVAQLAAALGESPPTMALPRPRRTPSRRRLALAAAVAIIAAGAMAAYGHLARPLPVAVAPARLPPHGRLLFQLNLSRPPADVVVTAGDPARDRVRFGGRAVRFDEGYGTPYPSLTTALHLGSFVADLAVQHLAGEGVYTLAFHGGSQGEDAVELSTAGQLLISRFRPGGAGAPATLLGPVSVGRVPAAADLAVAVQGSRIAVYLNGRPVGTARDPRLGPGFFSFDAMPFPGGRLSFRLTRWRIYAAPAGTAA